MRYFIAIFFCLVTAFCFGQFSSDSLIGKFDRFASKTDSLGNNVISVLSSLDSLEIKRKFKGLLSEGYEKINTINSIDSKSDSLLNFIEKAQGKYVNVVNRKVDDLQARVSSLNKKSYAKLARWESKLRKHLEKINPALASKLFSESRFTFEKLALYQKKGEQALLSYRAKYDQYRDKLTVKVKYLNQYKDNISSNIHSKTKTLENELNQLDSMMSLSDNLDELIKQRRKELVSTLKQTMLTNKYSKKISKEAYYYSETLKNYKEIFSDPQEIEKKVVEAIQMVPGFNQFALNNSGIASLFPGLNSSASSVSLDGLQSKKEVNEMIGNAIKIGGNQTQDVISQNINEAKAMLSNLKNKLSRTGNASSDLPEFKPNSQKPKTFSQRVEYGLNLQFVKANQFLPNAANIGVEAGYKLNDKSIIGLGVATRIEMTTNPKMSFNYNGFSLRSFLDWKLKHKFFITGCFEKDFVNTSSFSSTLKVSSFSYLIGISKKITFSSNLFKGVKVQILYDINHPQNGISTQPFVFRITQFVKN